MTSKRWITVNESEFGWEREALDFIKAGLTFDREPFRAWSNFEFVAEDGSINEVDLLVLTPKGLFLLEIKSWPGQLFGDINSWTRRHEGRTSSLDNPLFLANRKAKKLKSLLARQKSTDRRPIPFIETLVFLSHSSLDIQLNEAGRSRITMRDSPQGQRPGPVPGVLYSLTHMSPADEFRRQQDPIDASRAKALAELVKKAGIRPTEGSKRPKKVADYLLEKLLAEGPGYQDFLASHASAKVAPRRIRIYGVHTASTPELRQTIRRAAQREFEILEGLGHRSVLRAAQFTNSEHGPALVFEHDPEALRLDHYLARYGDRLDEGDRLSMLRQIGDALAYAHSKQLIHRSLSPQSIIIRKPESSQPWPQILNWQAAVRASERASTSRSRTGTIHVDDLVEAAAHAFMAPEAHDDPQAGVTADVFSFGALAYCIFSGRAPAANRDELCQKLQGKGLNIAEVLDGAAPSLVELIENATHPAVSERIETIKEALVYLELIEEELTRPDGEAEVDPREARAEQVLAGYTVKRRLGSGASAVAYLVEREGKKYVLKLALDSEQNRHLQDEAEVIKKLEPHQCIVVCHDQIFTHERVGLILSFCGDETLRDRLRQDGRLSLDLLARFGEDLLLAVQHIENNGIAHRDIKPENLGVSKRGLNSALHLVLFDFSLSRAPREQIRAGTIGYLDPFLALRKPRRWDESAERFSASVVLYEMATGILPRWGDGLSDPASIQEEASIESDLIEAPIRGLLSDFFMRAFRRDPRARFETAEDMLQEWRDIFRELKRPPTDHDRFDEDLLNAALAEATIDTPLTAIPLGALVQGAFERLAVSTIREALTLPAASLQAMRGVGSQTKKDLLAILKRLMEDFPPSAEGPGQGTGKKARKNRKISDSGDDDQDPMSLPLEKILEQVLHKLPGNKKTSATQREVLRLHLSLDPLPRPAETAWPTQVEVAQAVSLTRGRISQLLQKPKEAWAALASLAVIRDELVGLVEAMGGLAVLDELQKGLMARRGAAERNLPPGLSAAIVRAALEAELAQSAPRLTFRRGPVILIAQMNTEGGAEPEALLDYARRLGEEADRLAAAEPLPPPNRVSEVLRGLTPPAGFSILSSERLVRLAALASRRTAASSRLELYPRAMPPARALALAKGALVGVHTLNIQELRGRVAARYPEAQELPARPALDALLEQAGLDFRWVESDSHYRRRENLTEGISSDSTLKPRLPTATGISPTQPSPEQADARALEDRLSRAAREGSFLVLMTPPRYHQAAIRELARFEVTRVSLDEAILRHLRRAAEAHKVPWNRVLSVDGEGPSGKHWGNLLSLVREALQELSAEVLAQPGLVLLSEPGLLARYNRLDFIDMLRDRTSIRGGSSRDALRGVWLLVDQDLQQTRPLLDGQAIPVLGETQFARLFESWLQNEHRAAS